MARATYRLAVDIEHSVTTLTRAVPLPVAIRHAVRTGRRAQDIAVDIRNTFRQRRTTDSQCDKADTEACKNKTMIHFPEHLFACEIQRHPWVPTASVKH